MLGSEKEYLTGVLTILSGPQAGCSILVIIFRAITGKSHKIVGQRILPAQAHTKKGFCCALTMLMVHGRLDIVDGRIRHATALHHLLPFRGCLCECLGFDEGFKDDSVLHAGAISQEARVCKPFLFAKAGAQLAKKTLVAATE